MTAAPPDAFPFSGAFVMDRSLLRQHRFRRGVHDRGVEPDEGLLPGGAGDEEREVGVGHRARQKLVDGEGHHGVGPAVAVEVAAHERGGLRKVGFGVPSPSVSGRRSRRLFRTIEVASNVSLPKTTTLTVERPGAQAVGQDGHAFGRDLGDVLRGHGVGQRPECGRPSTRGADGLSEDTRSDKKSAFASAA